LSYVRMVGSGRNRTSCPKGLRLQRSGGTSLPLLALPELVAGPGVAPGSMRLMRPHGSLTDLPAAMAVAG